MDDIILPKATPVVKYEWANLFIEYGSYEQADSDSQDRSCDILPVAKIL